MKAESLVEDSAADSFVVADLDFVVADSFVVADPDSASAVDSSVVDWIVDCSAAVDNFEVEPD